MGAGRTYNHSGPNFSSLSLFPLLNRTIILVLMDKDRVAKILLEIGTVPELKGQNSFKTRAYVNAARTIKSLTEPRAKVVIENWLEEIKDIGEALEKKIIKLVMGGDHPAE